MLWFCKNSIQRTIFIYCLQNKKYKLVQLIGKSFLINPLLEEMFICFKQIISNQFNNSQDEYIRNEK
ncbi:unnamed protein product [Paramecium sonneborni]|uniref:Uncharacterized protein n=1 Tax=Paramecium sonneborni TaxID=65129 RepID=A0A8S1PH34_9CILI|nr:unnamed protein product [Paramecium sonneborni]